jgi:hypothetical protein
MTRPDRQLRPDRSPRGNPADRPAETRTPAAPGEPSLWAKAGLLDTRPGPGADDPAGADTRSTRDSADDRDEPPARPGFDVHERRSREIAEREGPLVERVTDVVRGYLDQIDPDAWLAGRSRDRRRMINKMCDDVRAAMRLPDLPVIAGNVAGYGGFVPGGAGRGIYVNDNMSIRTTLATVSHEMRHAYQHEVTEGRMEYRSEAPAWAHNFANYSDSEYVDYNDYATQPVEADAFGFERAVGRSLGLDWPDFNE